MFPDFTRINQRKIHTFVCNKQVRMIKSALIVGIGSFVGGALRYLLSTWMKNACTQGFPWGTLMVNLMGCFVIGLLYAFSTFANESLQLLQNGHWGSFLAYVAISVIVGISLTALGYWVVK